MKQKKSESISSKIVQENNKIKDTKVEEIRESGSKKASSVNTQRIEQRKEEKSLESNQENHEDLSEEQIRAKKLQEEKNEVATKN